MLLNGIVINPFLYFLIISIFTGTLSDFLPYQIFDSQIQSLPFIIQVFFGLLLIDIKVYIRHRFTHNYMWQVHAVHHTAHDINWVTGSRLHPSEILVDIIFTIPFMYLLGFSGEGIVYASFIVFLFNMFTHLNLNLEYPAPLRYIIGSPNFHRWHHAKYENEAFNKNFSVVFPFIDLILGTFYHPKGLLPKGYGILQKSGEPPIKNSLLGYLYFPFIK